MNSEVRIPPPDSVEQDQGLVVEVPRTGVPRVLILFLGLLAALLLFLFLDAQRRGAQRQAEVSQAPESAFAPPPPLIVPPDTSSAVEVSPRTAVEPLVPVFAPPLQYLPPAPAPARPLPVPPPPPPEPRGEPIIRQDMRPLPPPVRTDDRSGPRELRSGGSALVIDSAAAAIPVGTLIPAVLETPIDTSRPGFARAIVSKDALGADGQRAVVPRGSRLIGEYRSDVRDGQNRVLVNWTRLVLPDGAVIRLGAPAADALGGSGIPGRVHGFFLTRFLGSAIQTALSVGGNLLGGRSGNTVIVGVPNGGIAAVAGQGLVGTNDRRPKITVRQGTLFNVFVSRDVDFAAVPATTETAPAAPEQ